MKRPFGATSPWSKKSKACGSAGKWSLHLKRNESEPVEAGSFTLACGTLNISSFFDTEISALPALVQVNPGPT